MGRLLLFLFLFSLPLQGVEDLSHEAKQAYLEGNFPRALEIYQDLREMSASPELLYNIGSTYVGLGQDPAAVYYYKWALFLSPRDTKILHQLQLAEHRLGVPPTRPIWYRRLALSEYIWVTWAFLALAFLFLSSAIWFSPPLFRRLGALFAFCTLVLLGGLFYLQFFAPTEAVVTKTYGLFAGPDHGANPLQRKPIPRGLTVAIEEVLPDKSWLKVQMASGERGYLPKEVVAILPER